MPDTVLSHLAFRFTEQTENLATEALGFILARSGEARTALASLAKQLGCECPNDLAYRTQVSNDDGTRPDLVGTGPDGTVRVFLEVKYWAGLTEAQPVTYLKSLPASGGLLLFVAPVRRLDTLWAELVRRCTQEGYTGDPSVAPMPEQRQLRMNDLVLAVISWRTLLDVIGGAVELAGDSARAADVRQLRGLCDRMDTEAFLPLRSEELTSDVGRRIVQFGQLTRTLTDILVTKGHASVKGLRATGGNGYFGRYLRLKGYGCFLYYSSWKWANWGSSPLWLWIKGPDWKPFQVVRDALNDAGVQFRDHEDACHIPILLPTAVERDAVVAHALHQLEHIVEALPATEDAGIAVTQLPPEVGAEGDVDL